ncbi:MAG: hypothetical protein J6C51_02240 [Clostridia bacterium]|nr:hypothetical protein [Clostridia bacterium]
MFCTQCGRQLPKDGTPCVCGSGQTEKFTVEPHIPVMPEFEPETYYAPSHALQPNPLTEAIRSVGTSPVFLIAAIFMSLQLLLSVVLLFVPMDYYAIFSSVVPVLDSIVPGMGSEFMREMEAAVGNPYAAQLEGAFAGLLGLTVPALTTASFWMIFASAKKPYGPKTAGLTVLQVLQIISAVSCGIGALGAVFLVVVLAALLPMLIEELSYYGLTVTGNISGAITAVAVVLIVLIVLAVTFGLLFTIKSLNSVVRTKRALRTGSVHKGASRFVMVCCFVTAAMNLMNVYGTVQTLGVLYGVSGVLAAMANLFLALTIIRYNKAIKPFKTPKHAGPAQQNDLPYGEN